MESYDISVAFDYDIAAAHIGFTIPRFGKTQSREFKDFLVDKLRFEAPSCSRHDYMSIYKKADGKYYMKFALQFRFKLKK